MATLPNLPARARGDLSAHLVQSLHFQTEEREDPKVANGQRGEAWSFLKDWEQQKASLRPPCLLLFFTGDFQPLSLGLPSSHLSTISWPAPPAPNSTCFRWAASGVGTEWKLWNQSSSVNRTRQHKMCFWGRGDGSVCKCICRASLVISDCWNPQAAARVLWHDGRRRPGNLRKLTSQLAGGFHAESPRLKTKWKEKLTPSEVVLGLSQVYCGVPIN